MTDLIVIDTGRGRHRVAAGKSFGEIESVKAVSDLFAPLSGEVVDVNSQVTSNVTLLADDPYDAGWLIKIKVDKAVDTSGLMDLDAYEAMVAEEGR